MGRVTVNGDPNVAHKVGGVSRRGQDSPPVGGLVQRAVVRLGRLDFFQLSGEHPDGGEVREEDLGVRLPKHVVVLVPLAGLDEDSLSVHAVLGGLLELLRTVLDHKLQVDLVDLHRVPPRVVLLARGEEGLGEEEPGDPEHHRLALVDPVVEELNALLNLLDVGPHGLKRREGPLHPRGWDLSVEEGLARDIELIVHEGETLKGLAEVGHRGLDFGQQPVKPAELLHEHRIHRVVVVLGELLTRDLNVKFGRELAEDLLSDALHGLLVGHPTSRRVAALREHQGLQ